MPKTNPKFIFVILLISIIAFVGLVYIYVRPKPQTTTIPTTQTNDDSVPSDELNFITFQNVKYIPAKGIVLPSATIKKIGQTSDGIEVFDDESDPADQRDGAILIKLSDGNYQIYMKSNTQWE